MLSNRLAFAALAVACIGAAGAGGYFASRPNKAPLPAEAVASPNTVSPPAAAPVQETEAVIAETPQTPAFDPGASETRPAASPAKKVDHHTPSAAHSPAAAQAAHPAPAAKAAEPLPTLERTWPSSAGANPQQAPPGVTPAPLPTVEPPAPKPEERVAQEPPRAPEPPQKTFRELVVPADSVIGLQSETTLSSEKARVEDKVEARVTRDVRVHDMVAIPAGSRALGSVISVERGGKFKDRARLGIRFNMLVLADGTRMPISTETIYRDGDAPGKESAAKIGGGTAAGAILGAIFGGAKGAAIGATAGAGAGSATVMAGDRNSANLRSGEPITVRILSPVSVTVEQK